MEMLIKGFINEIDWRSRQRFPNFKPNITVTYGTKYAKVIVDDSAWAFIDLSNGDIYKPESWKRPAKHARGNIFTNYGCDALDQNGYVKYL